MQSQRIKQQSSSVKGRDICRANERTVFYIHSHQDFMPPNKSNMTSTVTSLNEMNRTQRLSSIVQLSDVCLA